MTEQFYPLHLAIIEGDEDEARKLIIADANLAESNQDGWTPLHLSAQTNSERISRWLINAGTKVNQRNERGVTPLHSCAWTNSLEVTRLLLKNGANPNLKDDAGWTPLMLAAWNNHHTIVDLLVQNGSSINARSKTGSTALHLAAYNNAALAVDVLLSNKASANLLNDESFTAYDLAVRRENIECATKLESRTTIGRNRDGDKTSRTSITVKKEDYLHTPTQMQRLALQGEPPTVQPQQVQMPAKTADLLSPGQSPQPVAEKADEQADQMPEQSGQPVAEKTDEQADQMPEQSGQPVAEKTDEQIDQMPEQSGQPVAEKTDVQADQMPEQSGQPVAEKADEQADQMPAQSRQPVAEKTDVQIDQMPVQSGQPVGGKTETHVSSVNTAPSKSSVTEEIINKDAFFRDEVEVDMPFLTEMTKEQSRLSSDGYSSEVLFPEQLVNISLNGDKMRRKSEVIIANLLFSFDINYVYERKLCGTVAVGINYPAFSMFTKDDRIIIWEHVSGLQKQEKRKQFDQLKRWYKLNGFIENENFFTTQDTETGGVDSPAILAVAEKIQEKMDAIEQSLQKKSSQ